MYAVVKRERPKALRRRKRILGLPIGPKQDYERPWVLTLDGAPIGYYRTEAEANEQLRIMQSMPDNVTAIIDDAIEAIRRTAEEPP